MNWQPIETVPKDGTRIDLWAKTWLVDVDAFGYRRFTDCFWVGADQLTGRKARWSGLDGGYFATHWMPLPEAPK